MHIRLGLNNGLILSSDDISDAALEDAISEVDGRIGSGDFKIVRVEGIEDALAFQTRVLNLALSGVDGTVSIEIAGQIHEFKSREVGWFRVVR